MTHLYGTIDYGDDDPPAVHIQVRGGHRHFREIVEHNIEQSWAKVEESIARATDSFDFDKHIEGQVNQAIRSAVDEAIHQYVFNGEGKEIIKQRVAEILSDKVVAGK